MCDYINSTLQPCVPTPCNFWSFGKENMSSILATMCGFRTGRICQAVFTNGLQEANSQTWHVESRFDVNMLWLSECQALWKCKALKTAPPDQKWHRHQLTPTTAIRKPQMSRDMRASNFFLPGYLFLVAPVMFHSCEYFWRLVTIFLKIAFLTRAP